VGGLGVSFLVRRARSSWLLLSCVAVTVLLTTGLAVVLWAFAAGAIPAGALNTLTAPQGRVIGLSSVVGDPGQAAADSRLIRATMTNAWPGVGFQLDGALWTNPLRLPASATSANFAQIQLAALDGISRQATLTAGTWPGPPHRGGPVPVALPAAVASQLHLAVGSALTGTTVASGASTSMRVTGLFRANDPASPYWALDLLPVSGVSVQGYTIGTAGPLGHGLGDTRVSYGPAVVDPAAFGRALAPGQASWMVLPRAQALARGNVGTLATSTGEAVSQLTVVPPEGIQVTSGLPRLLDGMADTIVLTRSLFAIGALELLLVAGAGLVLAARLLASLREEESALLRARGATRWQLARPVLAEAVVLGAVASLAGVLAGNRLAGVLASLGKLSLEGSPGISPLAWLSALATLVLCAAVMAWPAMRALTPDAARRSRGRQARLAGIAGAGGDLALVALAAVAVWELRGYSAVAHPATGSLGIDPVVAVAPALAVAGVALIPLRGLPLLARLADKATDRERRLAAALVSWQIARRPIRQAGPVLLVVIATATTTLALAGYASWRQSAADQAAFAVGSDVQVNSAAPLPLAAAGAITRAPGVTAETPASVAGLAHGGQLIALNASAAGNTILLRPDLSPLSPNALWQRITPRQTSGLALPGKPGRLEILAALGPVPESSAAQVRALNSGGPADPTAVIQDADGAVYEIPAGPLPFDGRPHPLVFTLAAARQVSYPLRLIGLTLTYVLPPFDPANPTSAPIASLTIQSLAVAATASGPFGRPYAPSALAAWLDQATSMSVPAGPPDAYGGIPPSDGAGPTVQSGQPVAGGGQRLTFNTGHDPSAQVMANLQMNPRQTIGQVGFAAQPPSQIIPAIATAGYLAANKLGIGSSVSVPLGGVPATVQIVASVARFPTVFGQNQALIVDLAEASDVLVAGQVMPLPVTRWWLRTAGGHPPPLPAGLRLSVTDRAGQQAALLGNELLKAPRQAMVAIGLATVLLGALGFSISIAASLRSRRTQSAVFAALGVGKNAQAGQLCLEQFALSVPAAVAGLLAGIGLAQLVVPAITLTTDAAAPVPSALPTVPLGPAVALALGTAAVPVAAAALSVLRRPDPAAQLRGEAR